MGTHHHKLYTPYVASEGVYKDLANTIMNWCRRREIDLARFAAISGVELERLERLMRPKPGYITVAEYSKIRSALNNQLPLHVIQGKPAPEEPVVVPPAPVVAEPRPDRKPRSAPKPDVPEAAPVPVDVHKELLENTLAIIERYGLTKAAVSRWAGFSHSYLNQVLNGTKRNAQFFERLLDLVTYEDGLPPELLALATKDPNQPLPTAALITDINPIVEEPLVPPADTPQTPGWTIVTRRYVEERFTVQGKSIDEALSNFRRKPPAPVEQKTLDQSEIIRVAREGV